MNKTLKTIIAILLTLTTLAAFSSCIELDQPISSMNTDGESQESHSDNSESKNEQTQEYPNNNPTNKEEQTQGYPNNKPTNKDEQTQESSDNNPTNKDEDTKEDESRSEETNDDSSTNTVYKIYAADNFSDGVAFVRLLKYEYESGTYLSTQNVLIDVSGKILFNLTELAETNSLPYGNFSPYKNGVSVFTTSSKEHTVYDKRGNLVISPEKQHFDSILAYSSDNRFFMVLDTVESFEGDIYMIGIIDQTGNYIIELSANNPVSELIRNAKESNKNYTVQYVQDDIFRIVVDPTWSMKTYYYHANRNIITNNYDHLELNGSLRLYKYEESGEKVQLFEDKKILSLFENAVLVRENDKCFIIDFQGNVIMDLSLYNLSGNYSYLNGYLLTQITNTTGAKYCCLFDPQGNLVTDPIRIDKKDEFSPLNTNGFIYRTINDDRTEKYFLYQYDGNIRELKYTGSSILSDQGYEFNDGLKAFCVNNEFIYINENEEIVINDDIISNVNKSV